MSYDILENKDNVVLKYVDPVPSIISRSLNDVRYSK